MPRSLLVTAHTEVWLVLGCAGATQQPGPYPLLLPCLKLCLNGLQLLQVLCPC